MLISEGNIKIIKATKQEMINKFRIDFKIHTGEAEALCLAKEKECPLAIDDLPTIKACKIMNQSFLTAIHFLINITEEKRIDNQIALAKLEKISFYGRYNRRITGDALKRIKGGD